MNIAFFEPPAGKSAGGLIAAIDNLRQAVTTAGLPVVDVLGPQTALAHFHGLWQPHFQRTAKECAGRKIPYVVSPHGMLEPWAFRNRWWKKLPYFHLLEKKFLSRASALFATSPGEASNLQKLFREQRIETVPLGVTGTARPDYPAARNALQWRADETVLLFLSRLDPKKGLDLLLLALAGAPRDAVARMRLIIVGTGDPDYVTRMKALAADLAPCLPPVEWHGDIWGDNRWKYFQGADLFCLPSHSENFGLAALEAMQTGTPVLITYKTPWPDFLGGKDGYFCDPTPESLRDALLRFLDEGRWPQERRERLAQWAWETFEWSKLAPAYVRIYRELMGS